MEPQNGSIPQVFGTKLKQKYLRTNQRKRNCLDARNAYVTFQENRTFIKTQYQIEDEIRAR